MKRYGLFFVIFLHILYLSQFAHADGLERCSGTDGIVCGNGAARCSDDVPPCQTRIQKTCDVFHKATPADGTIKIASFNLQVFGRSKASKAEVMEILAAIIAQYDVIAIQEIRDKTGTAIKELEAAVDDLGQDYSCIVGPRLGRTFSKEQYAIFFRTDLIQAGGSYTYVDSNDWFHREPFIAYFKVINQPFDFVLIDLHTDPDEAVREMNELPSVISDAQAHFSEPDVILLGDLNADGAYYDENDTTHPLRGSGYTWLIGNNEDTTVATSSNTYDRIVVTSGACEDYDGTAGVFRFDELLVLNCEPKEVSDHYPVFAEFRVNSDTN